MFRVRSRDVMVGDIGDRLPLLKTLSKPVSLSPPPPPPHTEQQQERLGVTLPTHRRYVHVEGVAQLCILMERQETSVSMNNFLYSRRHLMGVDGHA